MKTFYQIREPGFFSCKIYKTVEQYLEEMVVVKETETNYIVVKARDVNGEIFEPKRSFIPKSQHLPTKEEATERVKALLLALQYDMETKASHIKKMLEV
jgi:hypothetical protein